MLAVHAERDAAKEEQLEPGGGHDDVGLELAPRGEQEAPAR